MKSGAKRVAIEDSFGESRSKAITTRAAETDSSEPIRLAGIEIADEKFLKPMDIKRISRVPYLTVIEWLTRGHPRAGILPSVDMAETGKRHSYRVRPSDWEAFLARLRTTLKASPQPKPQPRPQDRPSKKKGMFNY